MKAWNWPKTKNNYKGITSFSFWRTSPTAVPPSIFGKYRNASACLASPWFSGHWVCATLEDTREAKRHFIAALVANKQTGGRESKVIAINQRACLEISAKNVWKIDILRNNLLRVLHWNATRKRFQIFSFFFASWLTWTFPWKYITHSERQASVG